MSIALHERKLLDPLPEATLLVSEEGRFLFVNKAGAELFQSTNRDMADKHFCEFVTEPSDDVGLYLRECSRSAQFHLGRFTFKTTLGREVICRCEGAHVVLSGGTDALIIRQTPRAAGKNPFVSLNGQIEALNRARHALERQVESRTADLLNARGILRELSAKLMRAQDEERRRLARELHDSTGQVLTGIQLNLGLLLASTDLAPENRTRLAQTIELTKQAISEVRTLSHLLHPPLLDEAGLPLALRSFAEGFEERSGIAVTVDVPEKFERIGSDLERAIFRIVQECLTNVHRHSGSTRAEVRLEEKGDNVKLEIRDEGRGMPGQSEGNGVATKDGVGLRGMQERVRLLGGTIEFLAAHPGTLIRVTLPRGVSSNCPDLQFESDEGKGKAGDENGG